MNNITQNEIPLEKMQAVQERIARLERFPVQGGAVRVMDSSWFKKEDATLQIPQAPHTNFLAWKCAN